MRDNSMWLNSCLNFSIFFGFFVLALVFNTERVLGEEPRLGLKGYDPVAYFTIGKPTKGNAKFQDLFEDVHYRFASAKHLKMFRTDPDKYAPRYTGLCAMGLGAKVYKVEANPENWTIHNGQLYLTQRSFGPPIFRKAPDKWSEAANKHVQVLKDAPIGTGISWW